MFGLTSPKPPSDPWPLKFRHYDFGVRCYNTLRCKVIYNHYCFTRLHLDTPSGAPPSDDWRDSWSAGHDGGYEFASPAEVEWTSLDGIEHQASVDIGELFKDRLVRHNVPRDSVLESWLAAKAVNPLSVDVLMEVNDRTISVYTRALVFTEEPQVPGSPGSGSRDDLILVWTQTY